MSYLLIGDETHKVIYGATRRGQVIKRTQTLAYGAVMSHLAASPRHPLMG